MTSPRHRPTLIGAAVLLALTLTACGDDDSAEAPEGASKEDFCAAVNFQPETPEDAATLTEDEQVEFVADGLDQAVEKFEEVGTPDDMPDDARAGFDVILETADTLTDDDIRAALGNGDDPFADVYDEDQKADVEAFATWSGDYCAE